MRAHLEKEHDVHEDLHTQTSRTASPAHGGPHGRGARLMAADAWSGAATYSPTVLRGYDIGVLAVVCRLVWRCPPAVMLAQYERNVGLRHLELGPGTGYFLDHCDPAAGSHISLVDLNPDVLAAAGRRLARYAPDTHLRNVLEPLELGDERFDSVGLNLLLHCVPGSIAEKAVIFDWFLPHLREEGRVFGSTILARGVHHTPVSALAARLLNARKVFHNVDDTAAELDAELGRRFSFHRLAIHGSMALFEARR